MVNVKVKEILDKNDRSIRWLSKRTNIEYSTLYNFINNNTQAVSYKVLESVCDVLECKIEDILEIVKDKKEI